MTAITTTPRDSGFYGGARAQVVVGDRGPVDIEPFPLAGGFAGWRFSETWSAELHVEYGFGKSAADGVQTLYGHGERHDEAGEGFSGLAVWKPRLPGRVGVGVTMGLAWQYTRTITTPVFIDPRLPLSEFATEHTRTEVGMGPTGGAMFPIAMGRGWSIAPEIRLAMLIEGEGGFYPQLYPAIRVMWGF